MIGPGPAGAGSTISGGTQYGPVLQGRDFRDVDIHVTVRAAAAASWGSWPGC
jgi:hypothetical protein